MRQTCEKEVPYSSAQMCALVGDVEKYPEFVPLWVGARIVKRFEQGYETEQVVRLGPLREKFRTSTQVNCPNEILVEAISGPFDVFRILWQFQDNDQANGCRVLVGFRADMKARILQRTVDKVAERMIANMVDAFVHRAGFVFGVEKNN